MKNRLSNLKNLLWAGAVLLCLLGLLLGLIFAMSQTYTGQRRDGTMVLGQLERPAKASEQSIAGLESRGPVLIPVPDRPKGNLQDVFSMTFLCDKTLLGLRSYASNYGEGASAQIWTDNGDGYPAKDAAETPIVFVDGSLITASSAAMITRPKTIVLYFGGDALAAATEQAFIEGYSRLIANIREASPSTNLIVCSIGSVSSNYQGGDGLDTNMIAQANYWIRQVCMNTGVYYADLASLLNNEYGYLDDAYMTPDGRSISAAGIAMVVDYFRFHYM